jgi:hypothetical protein
MVINFRLKPDNQQEALRNNRLILGSSATGLILFEKAKDLPGSVKIASAIGSRPA